MRLVLRFEFDGAPFCGWQLQTKQEKIPSIQGTIEKALATALHIPLIKIKGCGRTDAGVHAEEFFAHFDVEESQLKKLSPNFKEAAEKLRHKCNQILPPQIVATQIYLAPDTFNACDDVLSKTYEYRIYLRRGKPVLQRGRVWWLPIVPSSSDYELLEKTLKSFEGEHDFKAFAAANLTAKTTIRTVQIIDVEKKSLRDDERAGGGDLILIRLKAKGFLKQMVRNIVGTSMDVALGKMSLDQVLFALSPQNHNKNRIFTGYCAPADGLFLVEVEYQNGLISPLGHEDT